MSKPMTTEEENFELAKIMSEKSYDQELERYFRANLAKSTFRGPYCFSFGDDASGSTFRGSYHGSFGGGISTASCPDHLSFSDISSDTMLCSNYQFEGTNFGAICNDDGFKPTLRKRSPSDDDFSILALPFFPTKQKFRQFSLSFLPETSISDENGHVQVSCLDKELLMVLILGFISYFFFETVDEGTDINLHPFLSTVEHLPEYAQNPDYKNFGADKWLDTIYQNYSFVLDDVRKKYSSIVDEHGRYTMDYFYLVLSVVFNIDVCDTNAQNPFGYGGFMQIDTFTNGEIVGMSLHKIAYEELFRKCASESDSTILLRNLSEIYKERQTKRNFLLSEYTSMILEKKINGKKLFESCKREPLFNEENVLDLLKLFRDL